MQKVMILLCFSMAVAEGCGQTLSSLLSANGIPMDQFTSQELGERINAADGRDGLQTYIAYLTLDSKGELSDAPVLVRYDQSTGKVTRHNMRPGEVENCCGSPLKIDFTRQYLLVSFHNNPSANTVLVASKDLDYRRTLYGFDFHEIAPDLVVYIEDLVHFAAQHPERLAWVDLRNGAEGELYPPKGDRLREAFAVLHKEHLPTPAECRQANDPCDPAIYDEDIQFADRGTLREFAVSVTRSGNHTWVTKDMNLDVPIEETLYVYKLRGTGWFYCDRDLVPAELVKQNDADTLQASGVAANCEPNLPVIPDTSGLQNPFWPDARRGK